MFNRARSAAIAVAALAVASTAVMAAGLFSTFPIIGGASYCASTVTGTGSLSGATGQGQGTTGSICGQTVPAGPAWLTGTEVMPLDLYTPGVTPTSLGGQPTTAVLPITNFHAGYYQIDTTAGAVTVGNGIQNLILNVAATGVTVTLPAAPYDNQLVTISNVSTVVSSLVISANTGQSLVQNVAPTNLAAQTANTSATAGTTQIQYLYRASNTSWYRVE